MSKNNLSFLLFTISLFFILPAHCDQFQDSITAYLRSTPADLLYTLTFQGGTVPFTSLSDFESNTKITLSSTSETLTTSSISYIATALTTDLTVIQIVPVISYVPYGTTMTISFTDFSTDTSRVAHITNSPTLELVPLTGFTSSAISMLSISEKVDYVLEIAFIPLTVFSPFWTLYMETKYYRETLDLIKKVDIQYEPTLTAFYRNDDEKTGGLRLPNMFGILVLGNSFASEWDLHPENVIGFDSVDSDRIDDLKIMVNNEVNKYSSYVLFFDTFGTQLTVFVLFIILAVPFEVTYRILKYKRGDVSTDKTVPIIHKIKTIAWNLLFMMVMGSFQSFSYYTFIQIQAFTSVTTTHNTICFAVAVALFALALAAIIAYIIIVSRRAVIKYDTEALQNNLSEEDKKPIVLFRPVLLQYKLRKLYYPLSIFIMPIRAIAFSLIMFLLPDKPIIQTAVMLGITVLIIVGLAVLRPYKMLVYTIFKIIYEAIVMLVLILQLIQAIDDSKASFDSSLRSGFRTALIILWLVVPLFSILFAAISVFVYLKKNNIYPGRSLTFAKSKVVPFDLVVDKQKEEDPHSDSEQLNIPNNDLQNMQAVTNIENLTPVNGEREEVAPPASMNRLNLKKKQPPIVKVTPASPVSKLNNAPQNYNDQRVNSEENRPIVHTHNTIIEDNAKSLNNLPLNPGRRSSGGAVGTSSSRNNISHSRHFAITPIQLQLSPEAQKVIDVQGFTTYVHEQGSLTHIK